MTKSLIIFLFLLLSQSVFSFSAQDGQDKFDASFSLPGRRTNIYNCMSATVNTGCWSLENSTLSIIFNKASSVTDLRLLVFSFSTAPSYDYVLADGVRYSYNASGLSFDSVKELKFFPSFQSTGKVQFDLQYIKFNFETLVIPDIDTPTDNNIANGVNWSLFAYAFSIIGILFLVGRSVKVILDLIKYG
jgi:hypothetical protein